MHVYGKVPVKFASFLKSKMWRKIANPQKRLKTPPKELFKEAVHKISWTYVHWLTYKVRKSKALETETESETETEDEILGPKWQF